MRSSLTAIRSLTVGVCILLATSQFVSLAASNVMDCGSDAVIDIARNIANGHPGNKLVGYMRYHTAMHSGSVKALEDNLNATIAADIAVQNGTSNEAFQKRIQALKDRMEGKPEEVIGRSYMEQLNRLWDLAKNNISYDLDTIRMKARDADTGRLTCQAVMTAQLPEWGSAKIDVAYTVEKTTKGELYVEIFGLQ
jgi:hypothetical protein